jgi:hypothetical protein
MATESQTTPGWPHATREGLEIIARQWSDRNSGHRGTISLVQVSGMRSE